MGKVADDSKNEMNGFAESHTDVQSMYRITANRYIPQPQSVYISFGEDHWSR